MSNLQGKSTRSTQGRVILNNVCPIPPMLLTRHQNIILGIDVVKVNEVRFLDTYSRVVKFCTASEIHDTEIPTLITILKTIKAIYQVRGFNIISIAVDNAFEPMKQNSDFIDLKIPLNITSEDEHEPYIEWFNITLKEQCRMCFATLPFRQITRRTVVELVYLQFFWLNFSYPLTTYRLLWVLVHLYVVEHTITITFVDRVSSMANTYKLMKRLLTQ